MNWGSVKKSEGACVFCIIVIEGATYKYGTKYTSPPRVFDTPSSHSKFDSNSKWQENVFFLFLVVTFVRSLSNTGDFECVNDDSINPRSTHSLQSRWTVLLAQPLSSPGPQYGTVLGVPGGSAAAGLHGLSDEVAESVNCRQSVDKPLNPSSD